MPTRTACFDGPAARLPAGGSQGQQGLDLVAFGGQLVGQPVEAERNGADGVAQDHAQQRYGVARIVPRGFSAVPWTCTMPKSAMAVISQLVAPSR